MLVIYPSDKEVMFHTKIHIEGITDNQERKDLIIKHSTPGNLLAG